MTHDEDLGHSGHTANKEQRKTLNLVTDGKGRDRKRPGTAPRLLTSVNGNICWDREHGKRTDL